MKKPFKLKYTNGKTADAKTFPFKESPAKLIPQTYEGRPLVALGGMSGGGGSSVGISKDHKHTSDQITNVEGKETTEDIGTAVTAAGQQMGIGGNVANKTNTLYEDKSAPTVKKSPAKNYKRGLGSYKSMKKISN